MNFGEFFKTATGNTPYGYQCRLACGPEALVENVKTLEKSGACQSQLINVPTGLGKTAAVVLAWTWNRVHRQIPQWPRRLVYCLPMRTLVEQTAKNTREWLKKAKLEKVRVHILMGGEEADRENPWDIYPEKDAILIGTQDMLLSRALNRGYGMSRYRWPMHFGLLNNDCLWVMDETQLMGVGVETSAQLDGFRCDGEMPTVGACPTWWMSATLDESRLATVDHPKPDSGWHVLALSDAEKTTGRAHELVTAKKKLSAASIAINSTTKPGYAKQLAAFIKDRHQAGTLTLVVVNRVVRARETYETLASGKKPLYNPDRVALIHSRFRPEDRQKHESILFGSGDRIVIATQAVEAGVDVSARLLITELAPWSSFVQRMGRCNRYAEIADAQVQWVDIQPKDEKDDLLLPYTKGELDKAREAITSLADASPQTLRGLNVAEERMIRPVIRRRDLVDLFDTTPDICGQYLDISRYIRDGEDNDVQFFWREVDGDTPEENEAPPQRNELCRISITDAGKFLGKKPRAWRWNPLEERWESATHARPGGVYLVDVQAGGYDNALGWTGDPMDKPTPYPPKDGLPETYAGNRLSFLRTWQTIAEHTALVVKETDGLASLLTKDFQSALHAAALWHDVGKAHDDFQRMLRDGPHKPEDTAVLYAKSKNPPKLLSKAKEYRTIRHELASALAWLLAGPSNAPERDLIAYLIAAHHGKVRLSIRSLPGEEGDPQNAERPFARGIWHGDPLPAVALGEITTPAVNLDLSFMKMGEGPHGASWLARTIAQRDRLGPLRLAYLEALLRAADARASVGPLQLK